MKNRMAAIAAAIAFMLLAGAAVQAASSGTRQMSSSAVSASSPSSSPSNVSAASAARPDETKTKPVAVTLYFPKEDNSGVLQEKRVIYVKDGAILRAAIVALMEGPMQKGLRKGIPDKTRILGLKCVDNVAIADFSREFATANGISEITEKISVVNTLTGIGGVDRVRIYIEGKDWIAPSGMPYGKMKKTVLDKNGFPVKYDEKTFTLYFANGNADKIVAEKRKVNYPDSDKQEKVVFEELAQGPETKGLHPVIPKGVKLLSVETKNGICYLNLSHEFVDNNHVGSAGESMTLNSIVDSLTELPGIKKVQFLINGKIRKAYLHVIFDKPFGRNESIIKK